MTVLADTTASPRDRALAALAESPEGVVESIARNAGVSPAVVLDILPAGAAVTAPAEKFDEIWTEMTSWGEILMIVHTQDIVFEVNGTLPQGSEGHGWFNIHGDSPIGGHIRKDNCRSVSFVDRGFHGRRSCSVWFMNEAGEAMFKIFVRRDAQRELLPAQLAAFEALRTRFTA